MLDLALLRGGIVDSISRLGHDVSLRIRIPELAAYLKPGSQYVTLSLVDCSYLSLDAFEPDQAPIIDLTRLTKLRPKLIGMQWPKSTTPGFHVLVTKPDQNSPRGGLLRFSARDVFVQRETGEACSIPELQQAAALLTAERLRTTESPQKAFDRLIKENVAPLLASYGFNSLGRTFYYRSDGSISFCLELESSRFNTRLSSTFGINAQIYWGEPFAKLRSKKSLLQDNLCVWSERIGALWGNANETYTLSSAEDVLGLSERIQSDLQRYVFPIILQLSGFDDLIQFLERRNQNAEDKRHVYAMAKLFAQAGHKKKSQEYFRECLGDDELANSAIHRQAKFFGIDL